MKAQRYSPEVVKGKGAIWGIASGNAELQLRILSDTHSVAQISTVCHARSNERERVELRN